MVPDAAPFFVCSLADWNARRDGSEQHVHTLAPALYLALTASVSFEAAGRSDVADAPADALARLKSGNARFVANASEALPITAPRRAALGPKS